MMDSTDAASMLVYASRYAISRHTYASSEMARMVKKYHHLLNPSEKGTIISDIKKAFHERIVDELSTVQWEEVLEVLGGKR